MDSGTIAGIVSAVLASVLMYFGARFTSKQSARVAEAQVEVDQRKVDQEAFDRFVRRYETERQRQEETMRETQDLLRAALAHVTLLRAEMRARNVIAPPLPAELERIPWDFWSSGPYDSQS